LQDLGFDYTYDKQLYDKLGNGNLDNIRGYISGVPLQYHQHCARFVENHDEPRAASFFQNNMRADAAAMVSMTLPGMKFYNEGQQKGYFNRLDVHLLRAKQENVNDGVLQFYTKFRKILANEIFQKGSWEYLSVFGTDVSWRLMAWKWSYNSQKILCVINYSDKEGTGKIILRDALPVNGSDMIDVTELLSGTVYPRSAREMQNNGLFVIVSYWSIQMFQYE